MTKRSLIFFSALVVLMAGCGKSADLADMQEQLPVNNDWEYDISLPVPIEFGSVRMSTKAAIESQEGLLGKYFSFFADNKLTENALDDVSRLMYNRHGVYKLETGFKFSGKPIFYPVTSETQLSFYTVCAGPRGSTIGNDKVRDDGQRLFINVPVGTENDVIWGIAQTDDDGYNATYIRKNPALLPQFALMHATAAVSLAVVVDESAMDDADVVVEQVRYDNLALTADLCLIDKRTEILADDAITKGDMQVTSRGSVSFDGINNISEIFVVPQKDGEFFICTVLLGVSRGGGEQEQYSVEVEMNPNMIFQGLGKEEVGYVAGRRYNYLLNISYNPLSDKFEGVLEPKLSDE